ncbi:MAG TPA: SDR family oxidoreductase [Candidatus Dormibacteraeota bacterium]|jgi:NAD(P)-dependent dehydrogenase (short-subunit alcohol dehydrogenase family)
MRHRRNAEPLILAATAGAIVFATIRRIRQADLSGQVALITGGSRGLGLLLAREFAQAGCQLVICGRDEAQLGRAEQDLRNRGAVVLAIQCDVSDRAQVDHMVSQAVERVGPIDILVNNAGIIGVAPLQALELKDFEKAMNIMYWGTVYPTMAVLPAMRQRHNGRIVNITSIGGLVAVPHLLAYSSAKFAAVGFSQGLRAEVARDGIAVTTVAPGLMRTGSHLHAEFKGEQMKQYSLFAPLSSLPIISMDAERVARRIVTATRRGEAQLTLSLPANLLARVNGVMPGTTARTMGLVNRLLPNEGDPAAGTRPGIDLQREPHPRLVDLATTWARKAAGRFLEDGGADPVPH